MSIEQNFDDMPDHTTGGTSSIGGVWPPEAGSFRRIKGIYNKRTLQTQEEVQLLLDTFAEYRSRLGDVNSVETQGTPPTRVQFRALVEASVLSGFRGNEFMITNLEAIIPLDPGRLGEEPVLLYLGFNASSRQPDVDDLSLVRDNISRASLIQRRPMSEIIEKTQTNGYQVQILSERGEDEVQQLAALYKRFGWEIGEVREIVGNENNIFCVARDGDTIVSSGIAETAKIPFAQTSLNIAEITEAATLEGHGGKGLYTAVSTLLLMYLARDSWGKKDDEQIDVVFGECNGLSLPVLKTAKIQERVFCSEVGTRYGFPKSGILKQQVPISGYDRATDFNDLVPAFLTRSRLYDYYLV